MRRNYLVKTFSLIAIILSITACSLSFVNQDSSKTATSQAIPEIPYCDTDSSVLCVISFGIDTKNQLLVNFYKPKTSIPDFYLKIRYDEIEDTYKCQAVKDFPSYIYCSGKQIPLEEQVDIEVYSTGDDALIARGTFVISALAVATPVIVSATVGTPVTPQPTFALPTQTAFNPRTPTRGTGTPGTPTGTPATRTRTPTRTPTVSYPNP
jgi:hypothetical protein